MKFFDEALIQVYAGTGGHGCLSFLREKYRPEGGPDGGNGGRGGDIWIVADSGLNTLIDFRYKTIFKASSGDCGRGKLKSGKIGEDEIILVPVGTVIFDNNTKELIGDLHEDGSRVLVAKGGESGLGNAHFKSSTMRAPRKTTKGKKGESRSLFLEMRLIADIGLLGLPNAGKSTLISSLSNAKPKIANYPFTTTFPNLGVIEFDDGESMTMADIPGLIEGASHGSGLGTRFLKHLLRTKYLIHVVDISVGDEEKIFDNILTIDKEIEAYGKGLEKRIQIMVLNKVDISTLDHEILIKKLKQTNVFSGIFFVISAKDKMGLDKLNKHLSNLESF